MSSEDVITAVNLPVSRRLLVMLCFPLFIVLALPFWSYTTSIERLPLPKERIAALEKARDADIVTSVLFTADDAAFPQPPPGKAVFTKRAKLESLAEEVIKGVDGILARSRPAERGERRWKFEYEGDKKRRAPLRVHIAVSQTANASFPLEPYIQAPWAASPEVPTGTLVIPVHPSLISDRNLKRHYKIALVAAIHNLLPPHLPGVPPRALAYKPNVTLSFVLLNEDAAEGNYVDGWDIEDAIRDHFLPHLEPLEPVFNFFIESQVLYHAPLTFEPAHVGPEPAAESDTSIISQSDRGAWIIDDDGMKVFVSERWSLDSGSTNNPVLKFLVFVPSAKHRPMHLGIRDSADSFLIPQFGSVVLLNPPSSVTADSSYHLGLSALDATFIQFREHLYKLLAIPPLPAQLHSCPDESGARPLVARGLADPLSPWQLDQVLRSRLAENAAEARQTLAGIVRLVDKIEEMQLGEGVRSLVLGAVRRLEGLPAASRSPSPLPGFVLARDAVVLANKAFFDPSMMGLLYFPDQHKFAVYMPLFAPVGVALVIGMLRELVALKRRRKKAAEQAKTGSEPAADTEPVDVVPPASAGEPVADALVTSSRVTRSAHQRTATSATTE